MAFWVTDRDGTTFVSRAHSETRVRKEAEKRGLVIDEIIPVSSDTSPEDLDEYKQLTPSAVVAIQIFCLSAGQVSSLFLRAWCAFH